jgi:hypothetical protein
MLQARLLLVALLVPLAGAFALLGGTSIIANAVMTPYESAATTATSALRGAMVRLSSESVDAAAQAASEPDVIAAIAKKELSPKAQAALLASAGVFGAPTFAVVFGADGVVVGTAGGPSSLPASLKGLPVVAEALSGLARDGLWLDGGKPVHLAAAASYDGAAVAGGVVLGWAFTEELVGHLTPDATQAPAFVISSGGVVGKLPEGVTAENIKARELFGEVTSGGTFPVLVPDPHRYAVVVAPLYGTDMSVLAATLIDRDPALSGLAALQKGILGLTAALTLLVIVIIASTLRALSKPIDIILNHLAQVQQGATVGILPEAGLTGPFLRLGKQINMLVQTLPAMRGSTAPLGGGSGLFGGGPSAPAGVDAPLTFSGTPVSGPPAAVASSPPPPADLPPSTSPAFAAPPPPPPMPSPPSTSSGLAGLFDEPDPLAAFRVPPKAAPPAPPPPPPVAPPEPPAGEMNPEATVMFQVPQSLLQASSAAVPPSPPPAPSPPPPPPFSPPASFTPPGGDNDDDNRTVVAQVPKDLLSQSAQPANAGPDAADQAHYKEVFEKFLQTRIECSEDTSDLTYDRFVTKLLKNRQQILEKHKARGVRFQVYVKDGKAALRALPVRD